MIKLRFQGVLIEIMAALEIIQHDFNILSVSETYLHSAVSAYERVYVDVELVKKISSDKINKTWIEDKREGVV